MQSFVDCYASYHHILMDEEYVEKTAFITPRGVYHYRVIPFGDDVIIKSRESSNNLTHLRKLFNRLRRYNLKLNITKCAFGVLDSKLLGFILRRRGIELYPSKIKPIQELPLPKTRKEVMSFLGRLNYISRFINQSTWCVNLSSSF